MSKSLGPIHYNLYKKIKKQSELNLIIYDEFKQMISNDSYISNLGPIEEEIDLNNIHYSLNELINKVECSYARLINDILTININYLNKLKKLAFNFGKLYKFNSDISLEEVFKKIESFFLNGMPCDKVVSIIEINSREIVYRLDKDVHIMFNNLKYDSKYYYLLKDEIINGLLINTCYKVERNNFEYKIKIL